MLELDTPHRPARAHLHPAGDHGLESGRDGLRTAVRGWLGILVPRPRTTVEDSAGR